ncbi:uncharacterized protein LOC129956530 [Argiope bruennichi]|uniref:uncharacterized protein LOC129956530 n=1 Tax=Argiope bruennichi TaxID=94029 RepID=UPI00249570B6|nr:uncharacterized protein LOC129956530 [Argiope bruennichi]
MYVCVFVCFITKAVHLELVSDLSTDAFLASFKRFVGRRRKPAEIFSDCGTNFVKAKHVLKLWSSETIGRYLANEGVVRRTNVPSAPHFSGLWEASVKAMKYHLKRVIGCQILTNEEFSTVLVETEAVLNSRPLVVASNDPDDFSVITPDHFLVGSELQKIPEPDLTDQKISIQDRLKLTSQISQFFWRSWSKDYLTQLQVRNKWKTPGANLKVNDLVLIRDDNLLPIKWKMARVVETFEGISNYVRAVNLKTANGGLKRPIYKLVKLPIDIT